MSGSNRALIGKTWDGGPYALTAEAAEKYAAATDDRNPRYRDVAPPMSAVIYGLKHGAAIPVMDEKLMVDMSRLLKLLHGEQEIRWRRAVKPGETLVTEATLKDIVEKPSGELLQIETVSRDVHGQPAVEMSWGFFVRGGGGGGGGAKKEEEKKADAARAPEWQLAWTVAQDQSVRYAEASGDQNPIHVDDNVARMVGLKGRILHGLCTMAFAARAVIEKAAGGDPAKLKRLRVRFAKPVYPGETLTAFGWQVEPHLVGFEVKNGDGVAVLKDGVAELA